MDTNRPVGEIPLKNDLVLYSKFDGDSQFLYKSQSYVRAYVDKNAEVVRGFDGPYEIPYSSFGLAHLETATSTDLGYYTMNPPANLGSFSLSFFIRVTDSATTALYMDERQANRPRFSIIADGYDLEIHTHDSFTRLNDEATKTLFNHKFNNVLRRNRWTFVAIVYDLSTSSLTIYDQSGNVRWVKSNVRIYNALTSKVYVGMGYHDNRLDWITESTTIACLSLHNTVLAPVDVALLPCACQFKDVPQDP